MQRFWRIFLPFLFITAAAFAQLVPGRYVVELNGSPLGAEVRTKGKSALGNRLAPIRAEQARVKALIERNNGRVLSSVESVLNALLVAISDENAAALALLPGVKTVYPVHQLRINLDHALPIHHVPDAWARIGGKDKAGAGVKIAILDTGITPDHAAFQDPTLKPPPGFPQASKPTNLALTNNKIIVARSYEDIYQETEPDDARDRFGHGTATAMCAAGVTNTGPYATITGVAPKAWIGAYKISAGNQGNITDDVTLKAADDALADGMDVINFSVGTSFIDPLLDLAFDRLSQFGITVVVSGGNTGPGLNTTGSPAWLPSVITAGAVQSDRAFRGSVTIAGAAYTAFPSSNGPVPGPITSTVFDVSAVDTTSLLCSPLPVGAATGQIVLILRGTCTFEQKVKDAQAGGAIAVILYNNAAGGLNPFIGTATLPTVLLTNADGLALKSAVSSLPSTLVTVIANGVVTAENPHTLASFTSKGPNFDYSIKPDLVAVGTDVYMATQNVDPSGELYDKTGYTVQNGTSFSSPLVAGAVAVLRGARPGLTVEQYRSLIINSATSLIRDNGWVERIQQAGAGVLNVDNALQSNIATFPTSLSYGLGVGTLGGAITGDFNQLTLTNVGTANDTFHLSASAFDYAPPLQFSVVSSDLSPTDTLDITLKAGQSKTVYAFWTANDLVPGEYQGDIVVKSKNSYALVPYWYGVPIGVPASLNVLNPPPPQATAGTTIPVYVRVTDDIGYAILDNPSLAFRGIATGGGSVTLSPNVYLGNIREIDFKLGPRPGTNTFTVSFGKLVPTQFAIAGN